MRENILLIGPYSAVGGVSIHVKRLSALLSDYFNCLYVDESPIIGSKNEVFNLRSLNLFKYFRLVKESNYIHIHSGLWWLRIFHIFIAKYIFRKKTILTIHSLGQSRNGFSLFATKLSAKLVTKTVVVSREIFEVINYDKAIITPAFIPPNLSEEAELPIEVLELLEKHKSKKIIVGNAFKLLTYDGCDLYGLDLMLDLAIKIKQNALNYKIIFVVGSVTENDIFFKKYSSIIKNNFLDPFLTIIPYKISFVQLILKSDLVVRPTCSDGDALTIREALFLGKPVIASDVVIRPRNTILFKNRDIADLYSKVTKALSNVNIESHQIDTNCNNFETLKQEYLNLYK